jgi:hypothetical protein
VWVLRVVVLAALLLALLAGIPEGYRPPVLLVVLVAAGGLLAALRPDHLALSVTLCLVLAWWAVVLHSEMPIALLPAAAGVIAAHVAATLLAYGPATLRVDPALALLWTMRGATTWTGALVVWAVARAYAGHGSPELFWLTGLAAALAGAVAAGLAAPMRTESRS